MFLVRIFNSLRAEDLHWRRASSFLPALRKVKLVEEEEKNMNSNPNQNQNKNFKPPNKNFKNKNYPNKNKPSDKNGWWQGHRCKNEKGRPNPAILEKADLLVVGPSGARTNFGAQNPFQPVAMTCQQQLKTVLV